jgi:opacity protein-like surface antigen
VRIGAVGLMAVAAITGATTVVAADDSSENSGRPPWAGDGEPLFETGALGALAVGGRFNVQDSTRGTGTSTRVSLADHGAFAVTADVKADQGTQYELFYSREATALRSDGGFPRTDVTVEYLHLGGTLVLDDELKLKPYAAGGLGITRLTPDEVGNTDTRFSLSFGLGLKWPVTRSFSVRVEGRGFVTLVDSNTATFCRSDQDGLVCRIRGNGRTFLQGQFLAGAAFAF